MSSHSQFKKFNILQELEQAIKKKTQEKYNPHRSKSRTKYLLCNADPIKTTSNLFRSNLPPLTSILPTIAKSPQELRRTKSPNSSTYLFIKNKEAAEQKV